MTTKTKPFSAGHLLGPGLTLKILSLLMKNGRLPPAISLIIAHDIYADVGAEEPEVNDKVGPGWVGSQSWDS